MLLQDIAHAIIAAARQIDRLLVNQHSVYEAAHFDQLLRIAAVASEARDLPRRNRADLAEAHSARTDRFA